MRVDLTDHGIHHFTPMIDLHDKPAGLQLAQGVHRPARPDMGRHPLNGVIGQHIGMAVGAKARAYNAAGRTRC